MKNEKQVITEAAALLAERDALAAKMRELDGRITQCCRDYGDVMRLWGVSPVHLRRAVDSRTAGGTVTDRHSQRP